MRSVYFPISVLEMLQQTNAKVTYCWRGLQFCLQELHSSMPFTTYIQTIRVHLSASPKDRCRSAYQQINQIKTPPCKYLCCTYSSYSSYNAATVCHILTCKNACRSLSYPKGFHISQLCACTGSKRLGCYAVKKYSTACTYVRGPHGTA